MDQNVVNVYLSSVYSRASVLIYRNGILVHVSRKASFVCSSHTHLMHFRILQKVLTGLVHLPDLGVGVLFSCHTLKRVERRRVGTRATSGVSPLQ